MFDRIKAPPSQSDLKKTINISAAMSRDAEKKDVSTETPNWTYGKGMDNYEASIFHVNKQTMPLGAYFEAISQNPGGGPGVNSTMKRSSIEVMVAKKTERTIEVDRTKLIEPPRTRNKVSSTWPLFKVTVIQCITKVEDKMLKSGEIVENIDPEIINTLGQEKSPIVPGESNKADIPEESVLANPEEKNVLENKTEDGKTEENVAVEVVDTQMELDENKTKEKVVVENKSDDSLHVDENTGGDFKMLGAADAGLADIINPSPTESEKVAVDDTNEDDQILDVVTVDVEFDTAAAKPVDIETALGTAMDVHASQIIERKEEPTPEVEDDW
jgi:hypothetical protein